MTAPQELQLTLDQQRDLANLAFVLGHHPQTRDELAGLVKKVDERRFNTSFRDVAQKQQFEAYRKELEEKLDLNGARAAKARQDEQKAKLLERYGEQGFAGIEETYKKYGMNDYDAAATLYSVQAGDSDPTLRPPKPRPHSESTWEFPTVEDHHGKPMGFKEFAGNLKTASRDAAYRVIDEIQAFKNRSLSSAFHR